MTNLSRLTLATLLMGSLALPAIAQDTKSPKDVSATATSSVLTTKPAPATKTSEAPVKPSLLKHGVHKAAATSEVPAAVTKAPVAGTVTSAPAANVPSKDAKATSVTKDVTKDSAVKPQTTAPVTKTN